MDHGAGQFVNVELDGCYLRRPISVCDWDERTITLIYKVVGEGTALMAACGPARGSTCSRGWATAST